MERSPQDDPRFQQVEAKLRAAVVEMARVKAAEHINVSELAAAAGISRTTFYKHAESPAALLARVIIDQLRPSLDPLTALLSTAGPDYLLRWRDHFVSFLLSIKEDPELYRRVFDSETDVVVRSLVSKYLESVYHAYVKEFVAKVDDDFLTDLWVEMAASQQVHNTIVVISAWIRTGMRDSADAVAATYLSIAPPWQLAKFTPDGRASMKRTRAVSQILASH